MRQPLACAVSRWHCVALCLAPVAVLCSGCYLVKQGAHLLAWQASAKKVECFLSDTSDASQYHFLLRCDTIKRFAVDSLGLAPNRNYTRYLVSEQQVAAHVVSACRPDSFAMRRWCYPIVGCIPYKGYFDSADAEREANRLRQDGLDVYVWGASGFSTLGILPDPIVSYMRRHDVYQLASLLIHEQTHSTMYLKGQAQFNEELATFVARQGALRFIARTRGDSSATYRSAQRSIDEGMAFDRFIGELCESLDSVYRSAVPRDEKLRRKAQIIADAKASLDDSASAYGSGRRFRRFVDSDINNAWLGVHQTYRQDLGLYERVYEACGQDLRRTVAVLLGARKGRKAPRKHLEKWLAGGGERTE
jgi:predicted aminopeptidase